MTIATLIRTLAAALLAAGFATSPALAVSVNLGASTLNGNSVGPDHSTTGLLSIDPTFVNNLPIQLVVVTDAADYASSTCTLPAICIDWNGFYTNQRGTDWTSFTLTAGSPVSIAANGSVTPEFGALQGISNPDAQHAIIAFVPPGERSGFELGALDLGSQNWKLDIGSVVPTQSFTVTLTPTPSAVPVPAAGWLFGSAAGLIGFARLRVPVLRILRIC